MGLSSFNRARREQAEKKAKKSNVLTDEDQEKLNAEAAEKAEAEEQAAAEELAAKEQAEAETVKKAAKKKTAKKST